ncbi:Ankyrin repeat-containing protein [Phytophthora palmivora]|uniref:Ankyrin repeat-containing protein n=1 Tax=Phytophthora palmivora TaxID=4796 RepID=A0A2P4YBH3_9STRA|nr:Ankyrin repeat-containing protein [Phytophthora palmivora]
MMQLLFGAGAHTDKRDDNGWTAMHYSAACSTGLEALHFLCELLTDDFIDSQCNEGNTALHVAAGCGCLENVRTLLETAASPHICNFSGESAYHLALRNNHIQCAVVINDYQSWIEAYTEDDYAYYYNPGTGESSWYKPGHVLGDTKGQQLPLCLIPMVSPLTSLDNPTAAAKYEAARRRARKQRKRRQSKLHLTRGHEEAMQLTN